MNQNGFFPELKQT